MKKFISKISAVVLAILPLLSACNFGTQNIKPGESAIVTSGKGLIFGSITLTRKTQKQPTFYYTSADGTVEGAFQFNKNIGNFSTSDIRGRFAKIIAVELPPGDYQIKKIRFASGAAVGYVYIDTSDLSFQDIKFKVVAGRKTYLGDLLVDGEGSYMRGVAVKGISVRDRMDEDREIFIQYIPDIDGGQINKGLFDVR